MLKKINLRGIAESLSEKELKNVKGGSGGHCYQCMSGYTGYCPSGDCTDTASEACPGGWMEWEPGVNGAPEC